MTLKFNNQEQWRKAMAHAVEIVESIQGLALFPSVTITPNWSNGLVEIKVPIGTPLHAERMDNLQRACCLHDCEWMIMTHRPGGEFFREPYIVVRSLQDDVDD